VRLEWKTWAACDFYGWSLPTLGLSIDANLKGTGDCSRWFRVKLGLLFLHIQLHIDGKEPRQEDDSELGERDAR
jgi:hypothetical protein